MRILFLGDIVGRDARDEIIKRLPGWRKEWKLDAAIVNAENAANGFGLTAQICTDLFAAGVDCITTGNHVWDQREIMPYIMSEPRVIRPMNYPEGAPGRGTYTFTTGHGHKVMVANVMTRLFMDALDDPFSALDKLCAQTRLGGDINALVIDVHGEATSEKMALAHLVDGRASFVVGTHTHVPTADAHVMPRGTGYQTDAGMCGCYDSAAGFDPQLAVTRFMRKVPGERMRVAEGPVTLCGTLIDVDPKTGLCTAIQPLVTGGRLSERLPS